MGVCDGGINHPKVVLFGGKKCIYIYVCLWIHFVPFDRYCVGNGEEMRGCRTVIPFWKH